MCFVEYRKNKIKYQSKVRVAIQKEVAYYHLCIRDGDLCTGTMPRAFLMQDLTLVLLDCCTQSGWTLEIHVRGVTQLGT